VKVKLGMDTTEMTMAKKGAQSRNEVRMKTRGREMQFTRSHELSISPKRNLERDVTS